MSFKIDSIIFGFIGNIWLAVVTVPQGHFRWARYHKSRIFSREPKIMLAMKKIANRVRNFSYLFPPFFLPFFLPFFPPLFLFLLWIARKSP